MQAPPTLAPGTRGQHAAPTQAHAGVAKDRSTQEARFTTGFDRQSTPETPRSKCKHLRRLLLELGVSMLHRHRRTRVLPKPVRRRKLVLAPVEPPAAPAHSQTDASSSSICSDLANNCRNRSLRANEPSTNSASGLTPRATLPFNLTPAET